jgi:hypothetical protein
MLILLYTQQLGKFNRVKPTTDTVMGKITSGTSQTLVSLQIGFVHQHSE